MTVPSHATSAGDGGSRVPAVVGESVTGHSVPDRARGLAGRLSALFERDVEIVKRLNDAHRRLHGANERLWCGLAADAFGLVYDGAAPAGQSQIAKLMAGVSAAGGRDAQTEVLAALQQIHWTIRSAFHAYQDACEERRQLAVEVGELSQQLSEVLCADGWSQDEALDADVHELARSARRASARSAGLGVESTTG
jgi:hypothetical protein